MRIAVDMENVLADPKSWFLEVYNDRHGTEYRIDDVTHWDWVQDEIEFDEFMQTINNGWRSHTDEIAALDDDLCTCFHQLTTIPDSTVDIVTARTGVEREMQQWLDRHDVTEYDEFISIDPYDTKATLGYDIYIDDNPNLATNLDSDQTQYLVTWPWNQSARDHPRTIPVNRVSDAITDLCRPERLIDP